jgi:nucleoside-diphosphate-sugar epimerase
MRVLITGGAGFIGSHLATSLLSQGHHVTVVDDLSTGRYENIAHLEPYPGFRWVRGSVVREDVVAPLVEHSDVVFHLAAAVGVRLVVDKPIHTIQTNVHGTDTVLRCAARHGSLVIVASTSEVYGKSTALPFREDLDLVLGPPNKRRWGYAASKLLDEFLALAYWKEHQLPTIVVRFFNCVGPRQSSRYGMVLPNFVRQALSNAPMTVHGDGSQTRSFTWVGDVVWALEALMQERRAIGQIFNIGNDYEVSIADLAVRVKAAVRSTSEIQFVPYKQAYDGDFEDMARRIPDIAKLRNVIGYRPRVMLPEIIERTVDYWRHELSSDAASVSATGGLDRQLPYAPHLQPTDIGVAL